MNYGFRVFPPLLLDGVLFLWKVIRIKVTMLHQGYINVEVFDNNNLYKYVSLLRARGDEDGKSRETAFGGSYFLG